MLKVLFVTKSGYTKYENMNFRPHVGDKILNFFINPILTVNEVILFPTYYTEFPLPKGIENDTDIICFVD